MERNTITSPLALLRRIAGAAIATVDLMFNAGPRLAEIRHLASTSDAGLKARGLTRAGELSRILDR